MKIYPYDHVLRFRFESDTRPDIAHVVDLAGLAGFGECSCEDFQYRILPARMRGEQSARCKHIEAARQHLATMVIARIIESEKL